MTMMGTVGWGGGRGGLHGRKHVDRAMLLC